MKIVLTQLTKSYDKRVLDQINLSIDGYRTVAIIGKSGCGKSTLLRMMTGIETPDNGTITIDDVGVEASNLSEYQRNIGIVFQQHNLFPHLTLIENITIILEKLRKMSKQEAKEKATLLLKRLHLSEEMNKRPKFVSGGQAQRASIARALATEPSLVFMDEPTAALDPILTKEVLDAVVELRTFGTNFIFVTHELNFVRRFAEYVIFMDEGRIIEHGSVDILDQPKTIELNRFLEHERS